MSNPERPARPARRLRGGAKPSLSWRAARWLGRSLAFLRTLVRGNEIVFVLLAVAVGALSGAAVAAISYAAQLLHELAFAIAPGEHLSARGELPTWRVLAVPAVGGLLLGGLGLLLRRLPVRDAIDPIEANALYGGRLSLTDSAVVGLQTLISNGAGASIGLEAGYTQIGSGLSSAIGQRFRLRRNDLRTLVGCGAAGAIGAAFMAPLTGAFYAFELVIGNYTVANVVPVVASALAGTACARLLAAHSTPLEIPPDAALVWQGYLMLLGLAVIAALAGILLMLGVTATERLFRRLGIPRVLRAALGGTLIGALAINCPQVLGSGHGALAGLLQGPVAIDALAFVLVSKALASAVSIGSGFRGGLFYASLFMGALLGSLFAGIMQAQAPWLEPNPYVFAVIGMSSMAVSVVGGPLTMLFLALETTRDFGLTLPLTAAVLVAALTARRLFGYSFATWRFHLRGEAIRSAQDVGWIRNLTVGRLMRRDVRTVRADMSLAAFRRQFPLGSTGRVVVLDPAGRYAGIVLLADAHAPELDAQADGLAVEKLLRFHDAVLLPSMNAKGAVAALAAAEADALAVVDGTETRMVLGLLTEAHVLRRYAEELDRRRRELSGEA